MTTETKQQTRMYVQAAAAVCEEKKGIDTRILELDPIDSGLSDFFLVTSASNDRQAIAIADEIEDRLKKSFGLFPNSVEGRRLGQWILLDYVDFVVHVFLSDRRAFYDIERLRKSARPLTPAEFDAELRSALTARTVAARSKAAAAKPKARPAPRQKKPASKTTAKAKTSPRQKKAAKKKAVKAAAGKSKTRLAAKKMTSRKTSAKKSTAKKSPARKPAAKKKTR